MCPVVAPGRGRKKKAMTPGPEFFDETKWYSALAVSEKLSVSRDTVERWGKAGKVRARKIGSSVRYAGSDLNALMVPLGACV